MPRNSNREKSPTAKAFEAAKAAKAVTKEKLTKQNTDANAKAYEAAKAKYADAEREMNRERFEHIVGARMFKALTAIQSLRNTSNRRAYEYTEADVTKMFAALETEIKTTKLTFESALKATSKTGKGAPAATRFQF